MDAQQIPILHLDFETRSVEDVTEVGPVAYAQHPTTEVTAMAWCVQVGDTYGPVKVWTPNDGPIQQPLKGRFIIAAHNSAFERAIWNELLMRKHYFARQPIELFSCSAARAAMLGLPASLSTLALTLRLHNQKDAEGHALMMKMTKPPAVSYSPNLFGEVGLVFNNDPRDLKRQGEYCAQDVRVEIEADKAMGPMTAPERRVWLLDQRINQRGLAVDRPLCRSAMRIVSLEMGRRGESLSQLTGGMVGKATEPEKLKEFLEANGVRMPDGSRVNSIAIDIVADLLERDDLTPVVREVLEIRRDTAKSSTAKFAAMLRRSIHDGRMRDVLRYHGAFTGRWAGVGPQIQNFPRGIGEWTELLAQLFIDNEPEMIGALFCDVVDAAKQVLRGCIISPPGRSLLVWDFGQIEARFLPWLAGEKWKVKAFRDFDAAPKRLRKDFENYRLAYAATFAVPVASVDKAQRQIGKVCDLALGYQGGPGAFVSMQKIYRVSIADYIDDLRRKFPTAFHKAEKAYNRRGRDSDIDPKTWVAAEIVKLNWRRKHPATVDLWYGLEDAALEAMDKGKSSYRKIRFQRTNDFLKMILPSNRPLSYFRPSVSPGDFGKNQLNYWKTKDGRLVRETTYGGKLTENATQAGSRCVMSDGMLRLDAEGFEICGSVHDEVIAEEYDAKAKLRYDRGKKLMEQNSKWSRGLPLVVDGFVAKRYRK